VTTQSGPEQPPKRILILAGPNGAGKTRPELAAMRAGRMMLELIGNLVARGESFAFETTLADRAYVRRIAEWQRTGYHVTVLFLSLPSADAAIKRVQLRVAQGGHAIPEEVIRRRFAAGRGNFERSTSRWSTPGRCTKAPAVRLFC
jgi:predicted ABC-type ATPase